MISASELDGPQTDMGSSRIRRRRSVVCSIRYDLASGHWLVVIFQYFAYFFQIPPEKQTGKLEATSLQAYRPCEKPEIRIFCHTSHYTTCHIAQFEDMKGCDFQLITQDHF